jgi:AraC-like DNA-binding protein
VVQHVGGAAADQRFHLCQVLRCHHSLHGLALGIVFGRVHGNKGFNFQALRLGPDGNDGFGGEQVMAGAHKQDVFIASDRPERTEWTVLLEVHRALILQWNLLEYRDGPAPAGPLFDALNGVGAADLPVNRNHRRICSAGIYNPVGRLHLKLGQAHDQAIQGFRDGDLARQTGGVGFLRCEAAAALFICKRTLARRLKAEGTSFRQLRDGILSQQAIGYLRDSSVSVEAIAELLNYHDSANFRREFKRWFGVTPDQYRRRSASQP